MIIAEIILWFCIAVLFYCYLGYGIILYLLKIFKKQNTVGSLALLPKVSFVIPALNEATILPSKIKNTMALDYPFDHIEIIIVLDGSTDSSKEVLQQYKQIKTIVMPERRGKAAALNFAMQFVKHDFVIFSDANCMLNKTSFKNILRHFCNKNVGGVAGEKKIMQISGLGNAEGFYWKYESLMKTLDASFYTVTGATGELFAIRTALYTPLDVDTLLDDFVLSLKICLQGFTIVYEPEAFATEAPSSTLRDERVRKTRIAAGAFQSFRKINIKQLLSNKKLAFQFITRRWLRWLICPVSIIIMFILSGFLSIASDLIFYKILFASQVLFYMCAFGGWLLIKNNRSFFVLTIPFYFLFMNYCLLAGMFSFYSNKQTVLWQKAQRNL